MESEKKYPHIVGFDVETEGLNHKYHTIIELGSVKVDYKGQIIDKFSKLANPGRKLDKKITEITGITDEMLADAPPSYSVIKEWMNWLEPGDILVAHNAPFDINFVTYPYIKENIEFNDFFVVDTLHWSKSCFWQLKKHNLGFLLEYTKFSEGTLHRAFDDAMGAVHLASYMMKKCHQPEKPEDMYANFRLYGRNFKQYLKIDKI